MRLLFVTPECAPLTKTGGLGDVSASLPVALRALGIETRVLLPGYRDVLAALPDTRAVARLELLGFAANLLQSGGFLVLDCPELYRRDGGPYQDASGADWPDNALRFGLLSKAAAVLGGEASPLRWRADCVHCNDWPAALAAADLQFDPAARAASGLTVHNLAFPGNFDAPLPARPRVPQQGITSQGVAF